MAATRGLTMAAAATFAKAIGMNASALKKPAAKTA